ncbi:MAG: iron transporter [Chloroflexi bacterium]|nr:iron transporter [Chloroflexota bacterium]
MSKIVIPVSLAVSLLQWTEWLARLDFLLGPVMGLLNLPPAAALPIVSGMLINIYAVIAILAVIPFTLEQMTLIAIFTLIAHSLILEGVVQHRSGINVVKATLTRILAAIFTVFMVSRFFGGPGQAVAAPRAIAGPVSLLAALQAWAIDTPVLLVKVFGIIMLIMIVLEISKALRWIDRLLGVFQPVMRTFGLSGRTAMMFIAGNVFGLFYGGAVIVEESKRGHLTREEVERLHVSLGINHALIEDPALFAMLGVNPFWLWVPRLIVAIMFVQAYRGLKYLARRRLSR